ncbi:MAG: radical SAM protein, partial [Theionarchaea archaeon]|nr:radical SAM protein [Theionarchaea archaeon]
MQLQVSTPDYTEERGGKVLYFWGDYPHWVVTNGVGDKVLHALVRGAAFEEIFHYYARETGLPSEDAQKDLYEFLNPLIRVGIIHVERRPPVIPHVKDQFSMKDACHNVTSIVLNLTRACNYACKHCYTDADQPLPGELSCKEMISILRQVAPFMHVKILGFLGGEPLLRKKDVIKVAQYWIQKEKGLASVSTNGSLIDSHFAKKAADLNLAIQISVDGAHPETCDAVRGKGSWERAISGTKIAVKNGALTWLCMVYQRDNLDELEDFISLGIHLGVKGVRFIPYNYLGRGTTSNLVKVMPHQMVKKVYTILRTHPEWGDFID